MKTRSAVPDDFAAIAALISHYNETTQTQCIHSGEGAEEIAAALRAYHEEGEVAFAIGESEGELVGVFGGEYDAALGRAWLWGPFAEDAVWEETTRALEVEFFASLPKAIKRADCFLHRDNERGYQFYLQRGFKPAHIAHVYAAERLALLPPIDAACRRVVDVDIDSLVALHDKLFPNSYETARGMLEKNDDKHRLFVIGEEGRVQGYVYASLPEGGDEGYVDFLGVCEERRRQGLGRKLLNCALYWCFAECAVPVVHLTVGDERIYARALYESAGFSLKYAGIGARKDW